MWRRISLSLMRWTLLLVITTGIANAGEKVSNGGQDPNPADNPVQPDNPAQKKAAKPRLRFKSGPVCMCALGLGEREIRATELKRLKKKQKARYNDHEGGEDEDSD